MNHIKNIKFLVGNKNLLREALKPFDEIICSFLDELSKYLMNSESSLKYSDIKTFAFFCRKKYFKFKKKIFKFK